jgi:hypothetical protein
MKLPGYDDTVEVPSGIPDPASTSVGDIVGLILGLLLAVAVVGAIGLLLWGAIGWITSQGDKQKIEKARGTIVAAIIGLVIVLLSFVVVAAIGDIIEVPGISNLFGSN